MMGGCRDARDWKPARRGPIAPANAGQWVGSEWGGADIQNHANDPAGVAASSDQARASGWV